MLYESLARISAWILVWFRKMQKKNKIDEKIRISRFSGEERFGSSDLLLH